MQTLNTLLVAAQTAAPETQPIMIPLWQTLTGFIVLLISFATIFYKAIIKSKAYRADMHVQAVKDRDELIEGLSKRMNLLETKLKDQDARIKELNDRAVAAEAEVKVLTKYTNPEAMSSFAAAMNAVDATLRDLLYYTKENNQNA